MQPEPGGFGHLFQDGVVQLRILIVGKCTTLMTENHFPAGRQLPQHASGALYRGVQNRWTVLSDRRSSQLDSHLIDLPHIIGVGCFSLFRGINRRSAFPPPFRAWR